MQRPREWLNKLTFRSRIILVFTLITIILLIILARVSYLTVKDIYLNQLTEHVNLITRLTASEMETRYLDFLQPRPSRSAANRYYRDILSEHAANNLFTQAFIFNKDLRILVQTDTTLLEDNPLPALLLNRQELSILREDNSITSLPFRGNDGLWYLWGFYRINSHYYLGIQESAHRLARLDSLSRIFWIIGLGGLVITIAAGWFLARGVSRPVVRLVDFSARLGHGDFKAPIPQGMTAELGILSGALDKMRNDLARHHQEKQAMLAQIAHEIRNPLGGIELLAGLVKEDLQKEQKDIRYIQRILDEIAGLKELIPAYLNYNRPVQAHPEVVDLGKTAMEAIQLAAGNIRRKNIRIVNHTNGFQILFDASHIRQVILNLLTNSIEVSEEGGEISMTASQNSHQTVFRISDKGPGIPDNHLSKIFEPFFSTRQEGTGLGLAICKKLCSENQAEISVKNNAGQGCTFTVIARRS